MGGGSWPGSSTLKAKRMCAAKGALDANLCLFFISSYSMITVHPEPHNCLSSRDSNCFKTKGFDLRGGSLPVTKYRPCSTVHLLATGRSNRCQCILGVLQSLLHSWFKSSKVMVLF